MSWILVLFLYSADPVPRLITATTVASYGSVDECDAIAKDLVEYHPIPNAKMHYRCIRGPKK